MDIQLLKEILQVKVSGLVRQGVEPSKAADDSVREILGAISEELSASGRFQMRAVLAGAWREISSGV